MARVDTLARVAVVLKKLSDEHDRTCYSDRCEHYLNARAALDFLRGKGGK